MDGDGGGYNYFTNFTINCHIFTSPARVAAKYCDECVCVCVCLSASISPEPHVRSLSIFLCMLPMAVARSSSGMVTKSQGEWGNFGGCPGHSKALAIFAAAVTAVFAAKGIIQSPITSCSRRDHSVCQTSTTRNLDNPEYRQCGLSAGKGVMGVHSAGDV